jgi:hypothetical protein
MIYLPLTSSRAQYGEQLGHSLKFGADALTPSNFAIVVAVAGDDDTAGASIIFFTGFISDTFFLSFCGFLSIGFVSIGAFFSLIGTSDGTFIGKNGALLLNTTLDGSSSSVLFWLVVFCCWATCCVGAHDSVTVIE